jgi:NADH-quinone oxidoreductase subunit L
MFSVYLLLFLPFIGGLIAFVSGKINLKNKNINLAFWTAEIIGAVLFITTLILFLELNNNAVNIDYEWFKFGDFSLSLGIYIDNLSLVMLLVATGLGFLDIHFAHDYMKKDPDQARYYGKVLFFIGGMILLVSAKDMIGMFVGWEFMGLASYLLIGFWHTKNSASDASLQAFLYTRFGDIFIFAGIGLLFYFVGTLNLLELNELAIKNQIDKNIAFIIAVFIFIGAIGKSGQFPLFPWLMRAMEGPTTVSALIHGATMVNAGIYIVARLFDFYFYSDALVVVATIGALSAFIGASSALVQSEIKKVLAYSTMSHLSLAFVGLGVGSLMAGMTHLINHAVFKALLFLSAGTIILLTHHTKDMWKLGGLNKKLLFVSFLMAIGGASLAGVPPFSGFFSKDSVIASAILNSETGLFIAGLTLIAGLLSIVYISRLWILIFTKKPRNNQIFDEVQKPSFFWLILPLIIMALITFILGFYQEELAIFITGENYHMPHVDNLVYFILISMAILLFFTWLFYFKNIKLTEKISSHPLIKIIKNILLNGFYIEFIINWLTQNIFIQNIAKSMNFFDKKAIDDSIHRLVKFSQNIFKLISNIQTGKTGDYISFMLVGISLFLILIILIK